MLTPAMRSAAGVSDGAASRIQSNFDRITGKGRTMNASLNEMRQRLEAVNNVRFGTRLVGEFSAATREAQRLERQIGRLENRGNNGGGVLGNVISTAAIAYGAKDIISTGIQQKQISGAINFATGGQGNAAINQVRGVNDKYGLSNEAGMEGFKTIAGSTRGLGYTLKDNMNIYEGVSTGVAAMGLSAEKSKLAFLALGQMASKGKVSAEELRGQLGEQIPGALGIAARAMGMSQQKFSEMLDKGNIMANDFLPKFANQMRSEFGPAAMAMADGPQANLNRFQNAILDLKVAFTDQLLPALSPIINMLTSAATWFSRNSEIMVPLALGVTGVAIAFNLWRIGSNLLNTSLKANPILLIISGVILLASAVYGAYQKFGWFRGILYATWEAIKGFGMMIKEFVIDRLKGMLAGISGIGSAIVKFFKGDFKGAWETAKQAGSDLIGIDAMKNAVTNAKLIGKNAGLAYKRGVAEVEAEKQKKNATGGSGVDPNSLNTGNVVTNNGSTGGGLDAGKSKSESINNGGQRSIVINIGKQIEKMEISVMDARQGVNEIEAMVREAMRRVLYNLNGVATS